jgi:2-polyprenyl-3-methyl-5-hydroxy-6-metoxy-1,4-benzoquinol methylase
MSKRSSEKEILDLETPPREVFLKVMRRLAWQNWVTGHNEQLYRRVRVLCSERSPVTIVDVGTGLGDIPVYLARRFVVGGTQAHIIGVDMNAEVIELAKTETVLDTITFVSGRLEDLPGTYDVVVAAQMIHHLTPDEVVAFLRAAYAKANCGLVVSDFVRSRWAYILVKMFMYLTFADRINRNDGPLSVLRAYTLPELRAMLDKAGVPGAKLEQRFFRVFITARK